MRGSLDHVQNYMFSQEYCSKMDPPLGVGKEEKNGIQKRNRGKEKKK